MEDRSGWYEAEVLMADLTGHHHTMRGAREEEIEARMLLLYPGASTILVRPEEDAGPPHPPLRPGPATTAWWGCSRTGYPGRRFLPWPLSPDSLEGVFPEARIQVLT